MQGGIKDILNNFISNILDKENYYLKLGKVLIVNLIDFSFEFKPNDGSPTQTVSMAIIESTNNSFLVVPKINTLALVSYANKEEPYCIKVEEAQNIYIKATQTQFNEGVKGGLINIVDQTTKLNSLVTEMQAELVKIQTGIVGVGGAYVPGTLSQFNKNDFEDTKIKH